ncbi:MAG: penicillin-binding transpeptidase domain-containing protein [Minisyncoccia bacterium]
MKWRWRPKAHVTRDIAPDEIFADAQNRAGLDTDRFEGRMEKPLGYRSFLGVGIAIAAIIICYAGQAWNLQLKNGTAYAERAQQNQLANETLFAPRGLILDRDGRVLVGNNDPEDASFPTRQYADWRGIADVVGYAKPPAQDANGDYYQTQSVGQTGAEAAFSNRLTGTNGKELTETDALGRVVSQSTVIPATPGTNVTLSIDAPLSQALYDSIAKVAGETHFVGGAGIIMNVHTGEILALVSYPEYPLQTMANGTDTPAIKSLLSDPSLPFLDRATQGVFAPGSIVKPYVGVGALMEGVINENTKILSTGSISIPNPYDPGHPSVFLDWRPNGWVDMRQALAVSSDVYFYEVGGGYENQPGLGITKLDQYFKLFGFGQPTGIVGLPEASGNVPSPAWKAATFPSDPTWRLGDTYHTAIGQYGMQVTPIQMVRAVAALANGGGLMTPTILASSTPQGKDLNVVPHDVEVVREGMREGVMSGIAQALNLPFVEVAAKTGTAQVGNENQFDNSSVEGFFPYQDPEYAFMIMMEKAPAPVDVGATNVMADVLQWMHENEPGYLATTTPK